MCAEEGDKNEKKEANISPLDAALEPVDIAAEKLDLEPGLCEKIKQTKPEMIVHFPVKTGNRKIKVFTGYRIQHSIGHTSEASLHNPC